MRKVIKILEIAVICYLAYTFYRVAFAKEIWVQELFEATTYSLFGIAFLQLLKLFRKE